jgi:hypothetical protein
MSTKLKKYASVMPATPTIPFTNVLQEAFDLRDVPDCHQDEEILSNCCGSDPWTGNESMCGQCFEHAEFN